MRAGVCAAQQTLSAEAAAVLKHSLSLARRRGHAQVTPLHVAATLLTSRASLLRRACLKSQPHHHHPLHCRALELCFNVALNRLPASPAPLLHAQPSLSNASIAALKRAQAHQRRGCIEQHQNQQPPLIAIKVELEQLILSILDDPSVSRVMREAGFSSIAVKNNLEDCTNSVSSVFQYYNTSGGIYSTPSSPPTETQRVPLINPNSFWQPHLFSHSSDQNPNFLFFPQKKPNLICMTDVKLIIDALVGKRRRNAVIVGDSSSTVEALISHLMTRLEAGDVPDELKSAHLVKFQFASVPVALINKEEVDMNVADLKRKVDSFASVGRVIIYIGDLKWTVDQREDSGEYCGGVDHLILEIGKLVAWYNNSNTKVWLIATANYQTYVKCQMKQPPLDSQWALQAVSVPSGGLGLSLSAATSGKDSRIVFSENSSPVSEKRLLCLKEEGDVLTCCQECTSNYEREAALRSVQQKSFSDKETASAQLPYWLKPLAHQTSEKDALNPLRRKYNKLCQSLHQGIQNPHNQGNLGRNYYHTSSYPSWSNKNTVLANSETISFGFPVAKPNQGASTLPLPLPRFRRQQSCHIEFSFSNGNSKNGSEEPNLDPLKRIGDNEVMITLALGNSTYNDAVKHKKVMMTDLLMENLPWQREAIPSIVEALMDYGDVNQNQFILIQGNDNVGKRRLALVLAECMFGSSELVFCMNMRNNEKSCAENKQILETALRNQEKLVVLIEDAEFADPEMGKFLSDGIESGKMEACRKDSGRAIFILTTDGDASYDTNSVIQMKLVVNESGLALPTNLDHKRRADWEQISSKKSRRTSDMEEVTSNASSNGLDLNIRVDEDESKEGKLGELSPISSDLTREITMEPPHNSLSFLKKIKNRFVLNRGSEQEKQAREMFISKFKSLSNLKVQEKVLEQVLCGAGMFLNSSFGKWLKDILQTNLGSVSGEGEREKVSVRLCVVGEGESAKDGFMGTCLPERIPVSYIS